MIIFLEGLPGSGKSFSAVKDYLIPALQKGRKVFAYIEGLDFKRISEAAELPLQKVEALLVQVTREQVPTIYDHVENDALVIIDELQNFWPTSRLKLPDEITKFVAEHRHRGLDVVCMGQVLKDCHALWLGRVDTLLQFLKRDAIGKPNEYRWVVCKRAAGGKFAEATSGKAQYDPKYFGTYASHTEGTENLGTFNDDRANVRNGKTYKFVMRFIWVFVVAIGFVLYLLFGGGLEKSLTKPATAKGVSLDQLGTKADTKSEVKEARPAPKVTEANEPKGVADTKMADFVSDLCEKNRVRLTGVIQGLGKMAGGIEWRDASNRVLERLSFSELRGLGWYIMVSPDGSIAQISKPGKLYIATQWPTADDRETAPARVPEATQERISGPRPASYTAEPYQYRGTHVSELPGGSHNFAGGLATQSKPAETTYTLKPSG